MSNFVKQTIKESGFTPADVARRMGVTPQSVNNLQNTPEPRPRTLGKMLMALGWSVEDIAALTLGEVYGINEATPPESNGG